MGVSVVSASSRGSGLTADGLTKPQVLKPTTPDPTAKAAPSTGLIPDEAAPGQPPPASAETATPKAAPWDDLEAKAIAKFGDRFAGISNAEDANRVLVKSDPEAPLPALFEGKQVKNVEYSLKELEAYQARLGEAIPDLNKVNVRVALAGVDRTNNVLTVDVVGVEKDRRRVEETLLDLLGSRAPIAVTFVEGLLKTSSRTSDFAPHWGGARITSGGNTCSSGLSWVNSGGQGRIMTAGHCAALLTSWSTNAGVYGVSVWNGLNNSGNNKTDSASLDPGSAQGFFYVGNPTSNGGVRVGFYYPGEQNGVSGIRTSGAISGENQLIGNGSVLQTGVLGQTPSGQLSYGLTIAQCKSQGGDSGGPVFVVSGGDIIAAGTIVGQVAGFENTKCAYVPVTRIIQQYGGSPMG